MNTQQQRPDISIILPCLNEATAIAECINQVDTVITDNNLSAEIIVVDNDSDDASASIVADLQHRYPALRLIREPERGYGSVYRTGFEVARGKYIVMADSDLSYDFSTIPIFVDALEYGADFAIGNRFSGHMEPGSMPWLHRHIGNPLLSFLMRIFFKSRIRDAHCGMRSIKSEIVPHLHLRTTGMEFASEMIIKAHRNHIAIAEVPISYRRRAGTSKLRSFADGWRHLRFMLLYSPLVIFFIPGCISFLVGFVSMILLYTGRFELFGKQFIVHPIFVSSLLMIIGFQLSSFAGFAKAYAVTHLGEQSHLLERVMRYFSIEKAIIIGALGFLIGFGIFVYILVIWIQSNYGGLDQIKNGVAGLTLMTLGIQMISNAFMTSILGIRER